MTHPYTLKIAYMHPQLGGGALKFILPIALEQARSLGGVGKIFEGYNL